MRYKHVSACPKCGAPIYETSRTFDEPLGEAGKPVAYFTCKCRKTLPSHMPEVGSDALETTAQADRRTLEEARRMSGEPESEERADG